MSTGLGVEYFKNQEMGTLFACPICLDVVEPSQGVEHDCGKIFCKKCIAQWQTSHNDCPNCKTPLGSMLSRPLSRALTNTIQALVIHCPNVAHDSQLCSWEGAWERLSTHNRDCLYAKVPCTYGCGASILRKDLPTHLTGDCTNKPIQCRHCEGVHGASTIRAHEEKCERNMEAVIACSYAEAGCSFTGPRRLKASHELEQKDTHLELMWKYIHTLKQERDKVQRELALYEERQRQQRVGICPAKHILIRITYHSNSNMYVWNECRGTFRFSVGSWRCNTCDYDMCESCYSRRHFG